MRDKVTITTKQLIILLFAFGFVLYLHGAVPFFAIPTLGQAVWTTGFSQSFLNESIFSIYAINFGAPEPAAIAFGLAGAWPVALFIKLGFHPADAYSAMVAFWLTVILFSAYKIGRVLGVASSFAIIGAILWLSMPVIWAHAGYSMVSIGIGLLPFYFLAAFNLFLQNIDSSFEGVRKALLYIIACLIAVFMDGYSFMMFAVGASIFAAWVFVCFSEHRRTVVYYAFPTHVLGFGLAYLAYSLYIGKPQFEAAPIDFFRGWGVDLTFLAVPAKGMHWIPDLLGWSVQRSQVKFFGDASVWMTTFSLPIIIAACWSWWKAKESRKIATGILLVAVFGFYMALGPSLKVNSVKPTGENLGPMMPSEYAVAPTGSALLSEKLPGFKNMRASYRWLALGTFGGWLLVVLCLSSGNRRTAVLAATIVSLVTVLNLPHILRNWDDKVANRNMFLRIDADLLEGMEEVVYKKEKVAFLPYRNDFLVNYLAARLDVVSYNIGGDKNLVEARRHWPRTMREFAMASVDDGFAERVVLLLARNEADAVVLPYIDMLWAAHKWPYPVQFDETLRPVVAELNLIDFVDIIEKKYYAVARLDAEAGRLAQEGALEGRVLKALCLAPTCLRQREFSASTPSQVGLVENGRLVTDGNQGFLHFGPYHPMAGGRYRLVVRGSANAADTAWVDVVSAKGTVQHARFAVSPTQHEDSTVLAGGLVNLESPVEDIEIRVYVGEDDQVQLEGYELAPIADN